MSLEDEAWPTNKQLYEMQERNRQQMETLTQELKLTQQVIKKYNNLVGVVTSLSEWRKEVEGRDQGRSDFGKDIQGWVPWAFLVIMFIINLYLLFSGG